MFSLQFRVSFFIFNILISLSSFAQKITTFQHIYGIAQSQSYASSVVALPDKGFIIAGNTYATKDGFHKILMIRTDSVGKQLWAKTYSGIGSGNNESGVGFDLAAVDMILSPEGNIVICTNTFGRTALYLIKINLSGDILWSKTFPGGNFFAGATLSLSIENCQTGGYVLTGAANIMSKHSELFVIKTDTDGIVTWSKLYYHPGLQSTGVKIIPSRSGGFLICGVSSDSGTSNLAVEGNLTILKINKTGKIQWSKVFTNSSFTNTNLYQLDLSILELPNKSIYVNCSGLNHPGSVGAIFAKMDSSGNLLWSKIYSGQGVTNIYFRSAIYDSLKRTINISCEFETASSSVALYQCGVLRMDSSGKINFGKAFGPSSLPYVEYGATGHDFLHLSNGNFVMIQSEFKDPISGWYYFLVKMDSGLNSNNCNTSVFSISSSNYALQYLYSYKDTAVIFNAGSGCQANDVSITDSLFCAPFVANFGWVYQCSGNETLFQDSSYYKPTTWQWNFGDPASGNNTSVLQNPTHIYARSGIYTVKLVAGNGTQKDSISKKVAIHNPPPPTIEYATVISNNEIDITFQKSDTNNIKLYKVYRSTNGGTYQQAGTLNNISNADTIYLFKDNSVNTQQGRYGYKIVAINVCGAASDTSLVHQPIVLKEKAVGCTPTIQLSWTAYIGWASVPGSKTGIKKYEIYRSVNGGQESLLDSVNNTVTLYNDTGLDYHNSYCYRILAYDNSDSFVSWSGQVCGRISSPDSVTILAVTKTRTSPINGTLVIRWKNVTTAHLAYTELFYSTDGSLFNKLKGPMANGGFPQGVDSFIQTGLNTQNADEYYYMETVDSCGKISPPSVTSKTMTLSVSVGQLLHKLNWTPYQGFKIKEYKIERLQNGKFVTIDSVPGTDTFSRIFPAPCNYAIRYRIAAIGYDSGEVSWSDTMGRKAIDSIPSDRPILLNAMVLNGSSATINFIGSDSADTYEFAIQRAINGVWGTAGAIIFTKPGDSLQFSDSKINTTNDQICYTVITLDSCLNASSSDTVCLQRLTGSGLFCNAKAQLNWPTFSKPPASPDSLNIYRSFDRTHFNKTVTLSPIQNGYTDTSVSVGQPYYYTMSTVYKSGMTSYSDTIKITPRLIPDADTAQIVYATVIKSDEVKGAIYINWKRAALNDTNARGYYLYSFNSTNGKYALLKDITDLNDTTFINSDINTLKSIFKYYVITYNVCDVGINSNIHRTVLLNVQGKNLSEQLNWINYLGVPVKNYSIYKSVDGGSQNLVKEVGTDSSYLDSNIACNHNITYQIQAILSNGEITFSDSVTVRSYDSIRPKTEPIVVATITKTGTADGMITLMWNGAIDNNLEGYNIYRSIDGNFWAPILKNYTGTSLIDTGLNTYRQSYYYKVQPMDSCGNTGPYTFYHETVNLRASSGNGYNQLSWSGYVGWPVRKYLIYRDGIMIDTASNNVFKFKDTAIICHTIYQYLIKAVDSVNDTIISASNTDSAKAANHISPQKVYIKTVTVSKPNKAASISWTASKSYDLKDYLVYRKSAATGDMKLLDSTINTSYIDTFGSINGISGINKINGQDCYYVFARDHCGNISDGSNEGCIIILEAKNQQGYNQLSWNSYQHWLDGVQIYNVYKNEDSTGWQLIGVASPLTPLPGRGEFDDKKLGDSTVDFCYQVEAVENPGQYNQLSRSTVECVHQDATVFIPNSFTPYNQDGVNDLFGPKGIYIKSYDMKIYNRWGECVYASPASSRSIGTGSPSGEGAGWDGTFKGKPVQQGIYIYMITVTDYNGKQSYFKGTVTLFQ